MNSGICKLFPVLNGILMTKSHVQENFSFNTIFKNKNQKEIKEPKCICN
jgi:hypothetical protein